MYALSRMHPNADAQLCRFFETCGCVYAFLNSVAVCCDMALLNGLHGIPWQHYKICCPLHLSELS